jgi:hypothetical protein
MSLAGFSIALSHSGTLLGVGEPEQSRVKIFDKDGSIWVLRETIQGPPDSNFGFSVSIAVGPVHWRNNPKFRTPFLLGVGVAPKDEQQRVDMYKCGNGQTCQLVDTFRNINGKNGGPESFDVSQHGSVYAFGRAGTVEIYENSHEYELGPGLLRASVGASSGTTEVYAVRLSEDGDQLAVVEATTSSSRSQENRNFSLSIYEWDGASYSLKNGSAGLFETMGEISQRQLSMSGDGHVVAVGLSECHDRQIPIFAYDTVEQAWSRRESPPLPADSTCDGVVVSPEARFRAWNVATNFDGSTLALSRFPDKDSTVHVFFWNGTKWESLGKPLPAGTESSLSLSSDGAHVVIGLPYLLE